MVNLKFMLLLSIVVGILNFVLAIDTYASVKNPEDIYRLSTYLNARKCYDVYAKEELSSLGPGSFFDYKTVFEQKEKKKGYSFGEESAKSVYIPTYVGSGFTAVKADNNGKREEDSDFSCLQVFEGWNTTKGLKQLSDKFPPNDYLGMGYEVVKNGNGWVVSVSNGEGYTSEGSLTLTFDEKENDGYANRLKTCTGSIKINVGTYSYELACKNQGNKGNELVMMKDGDANSDFGEPLLENGWKAVYGDLCPKNKESSPSRDDCGELEADNVKELIRRLIKGEGVFLQDGTNATYGLKVLGTDLKEIKLDRINVKESLGETVSGYKLPAGGDGASKAAGSMLFKLGVNSNLPNQTNGEYVEYTWNDAYKYSLYYHYIVSLESLYKGSIQIGGEGKCGDSVGEWEYAFRNAESSSENKPAWCEVSIIGEKRDEILGAFVSIPTSDGMKKGTFKEIIKPDVIDYSKIKKDEYAELTLVNGVLNIGTAETEQPTTTDQGENASGTVAATCQNAGGAGSLGWIVCPILEWMGNAAEDIYTSYVEPSLKIDPRLFQEISGGGSPTQDAWRTFQTIANVVFIILLLIVIFSQLTGVGIDNYGIKRILPKLIVVAILVNLSYLICVICVDLSNILGSSLKGLFDSLGASLTLPTITAGNVTLNAIGNVVFAPLTILVALVLAVTVGIATGFINPGFLLTLLIAALGVVISILFVFVLFAVRGAAVVVLTVVSPIAFVCYALPNTKKIFDKWLKALQMLLLVYPICGLLIGGGDYVSRLLLAVGGGDANFFQLMTAMVVGIAPIFFIPSLLKGSFAAMGNIGAKVSGIGKTLSGRATKAATNSEINKRVQQRGTEHQTRIRAGVDRHGNEIRMDGKMGGIRRFIRGGNRSIAQAREQYTRDQNVARRREGLTEGVGFSAALIAQRKAAERDELSDYMTLINDQTRNGEQGDKLNDMFDEYMENGNKAGAVAVARIAGRRKDTAASFMKDKLTGVNASKYDSTMLQSVAKEIATGENSGNYLTSSPLGFEFAAQLNRGTAGSSNYSDWVAHQDASGSYDNVHRAMSNYVTDSKELVGAKNSSLGEIADLMQTGNMDATDVARLRSLANETIDNRAQTGVWDTTKVENIYKIAGRPFPGAPGGTGGSGGGSGTGGAGALGGGAGGSGASGGGAPGTPGTPAGGSGTPGGGAADGSAKPGEVFPLRGRVGGEDASLDANDSQMGLPRPNPQPRQIHQTRTFNPTNLNDRRELRQQRREIRNNRNNPPV